MEESLRLLNGNAWGSLRYNPNCITRQALPKAFQAKRKVDVTKAMKQREKENPRNESFSIEGMKRISRVFNFFFPEVSLKAFKFVSKKIQIKREDLLREDPQPTVRVSFA